MAMKGGIRVRLFGMIIALLALAATASAAVVTNAEATVTTTSGVAVTWRFVDQTRDAMTLEIIRAGVAGSMWTPRAARRVTRVAIPPHTLLRCVSHGQRDIIVDAPVVWRDVALARIEIRSGFEERLEEPFTTRTVQFEIAYPPEDGSPVRAPAPPSRFPTEFSFDHVVDAAVLNTPVPREFRRPDLRDFDTDAFYSAEGFVKRWSIPPDCRETLEVVDPPPPGALLSVSGLDVLRASGWKIAQRIRPLGNLQLWSAGEALPLYVSKQEILPSTIVYFRVPEPLSEGGTRRLFFTLDSKQEPKRYASVSWTSERARLDPDAATAIGEEGLRLFERPTLDTSTRGADIIYITTADFAETLDPLIARRTSQGYRAAIADVENIYLNFNAGVGGPDSDSVSGANAIRAFVAHAYGNWRAPAPTYLTLVGDASANLDDETTTLVANQIPTWYEGDISIIESQIENLFDDAAPMPVANDDGFATFEANGLLPSLIVGRIAVRERDEATSVVRKIIDYETNPEWGPWRARSLWMLDHGYEHLFEPPVAVPPESIATVRLEAYDYPWMDIYVPGMREKVSPDCNHEMQDRLADGCLTMHFAGHGGVTLFSRQKVFYEDDVGRLRNERRLMFCTQVSCFTGRFDYPDRDYQACIAEKMLRSDIGGAIGVLAASRALPGSEYHLQQGVFQYLYKRPRTTLGLASTSAKAHFVKSQSRRDGFGDSYNLLGDPATVFSHPTDDMVLNVTPARVSRPGPTSLVVTGMAPFARGHLWISLIDAKGRPLIAGEGDFDDGEFNATFDYQAKSTRETSVAVLAYAAAADSNRESARLLRVPIEPFLFDQAPTTSGARLEFVENSLRIRGRGIDKNLVDGETVFFDLGVANTGATTSEGGWLRLYHRRADEPTSETRVVSELRVGALQSREARAESLRWDDYEMVGQHIVEARLEGDDVATTQTTGKRTITVVAMPDLAVTSGSLEARLLPEHRLYVRVTIENQGDSATGATKTQFYAHDASNPGVGVPIAKPVTTPPLAPGKSITIGAESIALPEEVTSLVGVSISLDVLQDHTEIDERYGERKNRNNKASVVITQ